MNITKAEKDSLIMAARKASEHAYAPYSHYPVGAAVLTDTGDIFCGCNVENASFGLSICAERSAIFSARCSGHGKWKAVAVYSPCPPPPLPCGACRQVLAESGNKPLIIVIDYEDVIRTFDFNELLPHAFDTLLNRENISGSTGS